VAERRWLNGGVETSALYAALQYCDSLRSNSHDGATDCRCSIERQLDLCDFDFGQFHSVRTVLNTSSVGNQLFMGSDAPRENTHKN